MVSIKCLEWSPAVEWVNKKKGITVLVNVQRPPPKFFLVRLHFLFLISPRLCVPGIKEDMVGCPPPRRGEAKEYIEM
jgi:hypothetical protein